MIKEEEKFNHSNAPVRSLDSVLDSIGVSWFQIRLLCLCGLMFMTDAMEVTLLSFLSICAGVTFDLNDAQIASISSAVFAGQICGSLFWGPVADRYGRRTAFLFACGLMTVGGVLSGLSPNFESLVVFRALVRFIANMLARVIKFSFCNVDVIGWCWCGRRYGTI